MREHEPSWGEQRMMMLRENLGPRAADPALVRLAAKDTDRRIRRFREAEKAAEAAIDESSLPIRRTDDPDADRAAAESWTTQERPADEDGDLSDIIGEPGIPSSAPVVRKPTEEVLGVTA
jgi:hypothetical protein